MYDRPHQGRREGLGLPLRFDGVGARFIEPNKCETDKPGFNKPGIAKPGFDKSNHYIKNNPMLSNPVTLGKIMRFFKAQTTHMIRNIGKYSYIVIKLTVYRYFLKFGK